MRVDKKLIHILVSFAPLLVVFAAILLLGTVFLRAYDTGRPSPHILSGTTVNGAPTQRLD